MENTNTNSHKGVHIESFKHQAVSSEPIEKHYIPDYSEALFSNPLMTVYHAASTTKIDNNFYCIQKIENVPHLYAVFWIKRWNHILEIMKTGNNGILNYIECFVEKGLAPNTNNIYYVSEFAATTLRIAKDTYNLSLKEIIRAMLQITETLLQLQDSGYYHLNINPDTILVIENNDGTYTYKLANVGGWMKTHEVEYSKRPEYSHTIPLDYDPFNSTSKSDVYALGITIMEIIGVNLDSLIDYKTKCMDPDYKHVNLIIQWALVKLLLEAVHPHPAKRLSLKDLRDQLKLVMNYQSELDEVEYDIICASLEDVPLVVCQTDDILLKKNIQPRTNNEVKGGSIQIVSQENEKEEEKQQQSQQKEQGGNLIAISISNIEGQYNAAGQEQGQGRMPVPPVHQDLNANNNNPNGNINFGANVVGNLPKVPESQDSFLKKLCYRCYWILFMTLSLVSLALGTAIIVVHYGTKVANAGDVYGGALGIYKNLGDLPISAIMLASSCPAGYEPAKLGEFPGTKSFCYKDGAVDTRYDESCVWLTSAVPRQTYISWKNATVCVKRITDVVNATSCPQGYTQCTPGLCAVGGITELHFEDSARTDSGWYSVSYNDSNSYINYRKDVGVLPITLLDVVHGEATSCLNPLEYGRQANYDAIEIRG